MADRFLSALKVIERQRNEEFTFDDQAFIRLQELTKTMTNEVISDNDYLKLLELYYKKYTDAMEKSSRLYCLLRMQQVARAKTHAFWRRAFQYVEFQENWDASTKEFLASTSPRLQQMRHRAMIPILGVGTIVYTIVLCLLVYGLRCSFVGSLIFSLLLWDLFLVYGYYVVVEMIVSEKLSHMLNKMEPVWIDFEKKRACDSFKVFHKLKK